MKPKQLPVSHLRHAATGFGVKNTSRKYQNRNRTLHLRHFSQKTALLWLPLWCSLCVPLMAQRVGDLSNLRSRYVAAGQPLQVLDTLTVAAPLLSVSDSASGQPLDLRFFSLENTALRTDTAALRRACPQCRTLLVAYRVLPFDLAAPVSRLDTAAIRRARRGEPDIAFDYAPFEANARPWETSGLTSNGAYTRGLSFGNNQNLVFNSNLNLQLDGRLGNDLELTAALSDNSVPLQPDGTTRQLQEFDRIFIQLKRKQTALTAGDFDLAAPPYGGYFSQYFKRVQGAMVTVAPPRPPGGGVEDSGLGIFKKSKGKASSSAALDPKLFSPPPGGLGGSLRAAAAVSRGKFARQIIQGQEGNQGPYRLQGAEGERFIIVLAGTEKVFVDGQPMRRGLQDDYIVDYNLGELTFTARRLVTKDIRIIVEFEYAVQTYLRSTTAANAGWAWGKNRAWLNLYSEQDSRSNSASGDLSPDERRRLAEAGDNLRNAFASGVDTLPDFDPNRVLYRYADTLACGFAQRVLVYSTDVATARYTARFSEVAQGQGNYVQALTAANGRVFRWVAPDPVSCQPQGNFEPIVRLVAPELRQLHTVGTDLQVFKNGSLTAEAALSNRDLNRFSPLGNADDLGGAVFLGFRQPLGFRPPKSSNLPESPKTHWQGEFQGNFERTTQQFRPLNPYRPAEFVRDWNADNSRDTVGEQVIRAGLSASRTDWGQGRYEFGAFTREGVYAGQRHFGQMRVQRRGFEVFAEGNFLNTDGTAERSRFSRPKAEVSKTFFQKKNALSGAAVQVDTAVLNGTSGDTLRQPSTVHRPPSLKLGFYTERERNQRTAAGADTLSRASFWYDVYRFYFQTLDTRRSWQLGGSLSQRNDFFPVGAFFKQNTAANDLNINGTWQEAGSKGQATKQPNNSATQQLTWNLTYRTLRILDPELTDQTEQRTYLGRVDYNLSAWRNTLNLTTGYELGSGQSPRVEFNYLAVNPGEGQYSWVDRNRDSILQVDEMEVAVFQDQANYVRVAVTTPNYVRTNNVVLNQNLRLDPRILWGQSKRRWQRRLSRLSTQSTLLINRRSFAEAAGVSAWNPFQFALADTALAALNLSLRNALFVNRANPAWDASLAQGDNQSQVLLTTGFERRRNLDHTLHGRLSIGQRWSAEADVTQGEKSSDNEAFSTRNFRIGFWEAGPKLSWLPDRTFRTVFDFKTKISQNALGNREKAAQTEWNAELTWNPSSRQNAQGFRAATSLRLRGTFTDIRYTGPSNTAVAFTMLEGLQDGRNFLWSLTLDRQLSKSIQLNLNYEGRKTGDNRTVHVGRAQVRAVF